MVRKLASAIIVASALNAAQVNALGLGELQLHSALNEPLNAEIILLNVGDLANNQILVSLANREDFEKAGVERNFFLTNLKFNVQLDGKGNGVIKIKTRRLVNEPYLNFVVEAKWPSGKLLREYTSLLDLPIFTEEKTSTTINLGTTAEHTASEKSQPQPQPVQKPLMKSPVATASSVSRYEGESYQIAKNDTLWKIASKVRPSENVSIQQTMVALQQINPDAFINNNINLLKAGHVLRVPDEQKVRDINVRYAMREVAAQNKAWQGSSAGAQMDATSRSTEPTKSVEREGGRLSLSSATTSADANADAGGSGDITALQNQLAVSEEGLDKASRDNEDLQSELSEVKAQMETLQRLVSLKDDQLAALQGNVADDEQPEVSAEDGSVVDETQDMAAESSADEQVQAKDEGTSVVEAETKKPEVEKPEVKKPVVTMKPKVEKSFLDQLLENPLYLGGALLALLALIGGIIIKSRSAGAEELDDSFAEALAESETDFDEEFDESQEEVDQDGAYEEGDDSEDADEGDEESTETAQSETGDAIGEADIYVAYGRFQHAIDLLKNAISSEQQRTDLRLKLLEVYLEAGDKEGFQEQFTELQKLSDEEAIGQAKEMLSSVDGAADWLDDIGGDIGAVEESFESEAGFDESLAEEESDDELEDLELDLGTLEDEELVDSSDKPIEYDIEGLGLETEDELEVDVELSSEDLSENTEEELEDSFSLDMVEDGPGGESDEGFDEIDLDLELDLDASDDSEELAEGLDIESDIDLDDDFELEEAVESETVEADAVVSEELEDLDIDLDEDLGSFDAEDLDAEADAELETGEGESSVEEDEFEFLSDADEVATKLDLARAYIDMGDVDGAKDILDEVLQEGEEAQKAEANSLLERIG